MITYKYKLYSSKRLRHISAAIDEACLVWNHCLALQKRYYRMFGKYVPKFTMSKHMTKVWHRQHIGSQTLQEIVERLDKSYRRFFEHKASRPPKFKKMEFFTSIVMKQCGYKFEGNHVTLSFVNGKYKYGFSKSRNIEGNIKTVTLRRDNLGCYYITVVTDSKPKAYAKSRNGASAGIDFGMKTYMTLSDGKTVENPQFLKQSLSEVQKASRKLSKAKKGSNNRERARLAYARSQKHVADKRRDWQWKLAHNLCREYDYIFLETLNIESMRRIWGRKISDLSHSEFVDILKQVADKYGCVVHEIDRWYPSSKMCECGYKNENLSLRDRKWTCPACGKVHSRDLNAAKNILRKGISELESSGKSIAASAAGTCACI